MILPLLILAAMGVDPPKAVISAPATVDPGDLVVLDGSKSTNAVAFRWLLVSHKKTCLEVDGGKRCVFSSGSAADYRFVLVVAGQGAAVDVAECTVTVGTPIPPAPPSPPAPQPLPPGTFGLAGKARGWVGAKIARTTAKSEAAALAASFDGIAASIGGVPNQPIADVLTNTRAANQAALKDAYDAWLPWREALRDELSSLAKAKKLVTPAHHATAWREIATGLRAVGN